MSGKIYAVGIGPGDIKHISGYAIWVLDHVDVIVGYTKYIDLIKPLLRGKEVIVSAMTKEKERCLEALICAE